MKGGLYGITSSTNVRIYVPVFPGDPNPAPTVFMEMLSRMMNTVLAVIQTSKLDPLDIAVVGREPGPRHPDAPPDVFGMKLLYTSTPPDIVEVYGKLLFMITGHDINNGDDNASLRPSLHGLATGAGAAVNSYWNLLTLSIVCNVLDKMQWTIAHIIKNDSNFTGHPGASTSRIDFTCPQHNSTMRFQFASVFDIGTGPQHQLVLSSAQDMQQAVPVAIAHSFVEAATGQPLKHALFIAAATGEHAKAQADKMATVTREHVEDAGVNVGVDHATIKQNTINVIEGSKNFAGIATITIMSDIFLTIALDLAPTLKILAKEESRGNGVYCVANGMKLTAKQMAAGVHHKLGKRPDSVFEHCKEEFHIRHSASRFSESTMKRLSNVCGPVAVNLLRPGSPYRPSLEVLGNAKQGKALDLRTRDAIVKMLTHAARDSLKSCTELVRFTSFNGHPPSLRTMIAFHLCTLLTGSSMAASLAGRRLGTNRKTKTGQRHCHAIPYFHNNSNQKRGRCRRRNSAHIQGNE